MGEAALPLQAKKKALVTPARRSNRGRIADNLLLFAVILGALYWLLDTAVQAFLFRRGSFAACLLPADAHVFYLRALVVCMLLLGAEVARGVVNRLKAVEAALRVTRDELEERVRRRTRDLSRMNAELEQEAARRRQTEEALRVEERRYRALFNEAPVGYHELDLDGRVVRVNQTEVKMLGCAHEGEVVGRYIWDFMLEAGASQQATRAKLSGAAAPGAAFERVMRHKDGATFTTLMEDRLLRGPDGDIIGIRTTVQDISDKKRAEEAVRQLAYYDTVTGLPNRALLEDRLAVAVNQARRNRRTLALFFLDLDNFKQVNDTLGHAAGDRLLRAVGGRLTQVLRGGDTVSRPGGDEFVLLCPEIGTAEHAGRIAAKIMETLRRPFQCDGHDIRVSASVGLALYPDDVTDPDQLMKHADTAMYRAKKLGRDLVQRYRPMTQAAALDTAPHPREADSARSSAPAIV